LSLQRLLAELVTHLRRGGWGQDLGYPLFEYPIKEGGLYVEGNRLSPSAYPPKPVSFTSIIDTSDWPEKVCLELFYQFKTQEIGRWSRFRVYLVTGCLPVKKGREFSSGCAQIHEMDHLTGNSEIEMEGSKLRLVSTPLKMPKRRGIYTVVLHPGEDGGVVKGICFLNAVP